MVRSEGVGWIVVVEVGWHGTTLDDGITDPFPLFSYTTGLTPVGQFQIVQQGPSLGPQTRQTQHPS
jgi:hypothetical protein